MSADGFQLNFNDSATPIHIHRWLPEAAAPWANLLVVHGMAEHGARYARFAAAANAAGIAVHALDLPGHGRSAGTPPASVEAAADWLIALLDFKSTLPALGQLAVQVGQAGRVGFGLQGQFKRAALLTN